MSFSDIATNTASADILAARIYSLIDPWERCDYTPEDIEQQIEERPAETINYLLDIIDDLQA